MFIISEEKGATMSEMPSGPSAINDEDNFYTLVPEQGLCLAGDDIVNLRKAAVIRKIEGKTLIYYAGAGEPVILPLKAFDFIRDAVFAIDDVDDDEDFDEEE